MNRVVYLFVYDRSSQYTVEHKRGVLNDGVEWLSTDPCKGVRCPPIFSLSNLINVGWLVRKCVDIYIYTSFNCWH